MNEQMKDEIRTLVREQYSMEALPARRPGPVAVPRGALQLEIAVPERVQAFRSDTPLRI